jgi:hypothetical protein
MKTIELCLNIIFYVFVYYNEEIKDLRLINIYRVSILKVEHRQLTLCIQFIGIMLLFLYITH